MANIVQVGPSTRTEPRASDDDASSISGSSYIGSDSPDRDSATCQWRTDSDGEEEHAGERPTKPRHLKNENSGGVGNDIDVNVNAQNRPMGQLQLASQEMFTGALQDVPGGLEASEANITAEISESLLRESVSISNESPVPEARGTAVDVVIGAGVFAEEDRYSDANTLHPEEAIQETPTLTQSEAPPEAEVEASAHATIPLQQDDSLSIRTSSESEGSPRQAITRSRGEVSPQPESRSLLDALDSSVPANGQRSSYRISGTGRRGPVIVYGGYRSRPNARDLPQPPAQPVRSMLLPSQEPPLPARPPTPPPLPRDPMIAAASQPRAGISNAQSNSDDNGSERRPPGAIVVLPRWQPDAEVTLCPICHTQFGWLNRKHHCRKCGRVVCNSCSPHRITIPYQFIVQPPGIPQRSPSSLPLDSPGVYTDFNSLGGGERVRLCNPCVPDPNTSPPQAHQSASRAGHSRSQSGFASAIGVDLRRGPVHFSAPAIENSGRSVPVNRGLSPTGGMQSTTVSATSPALGLPARQRSIFDIPPSEDLAGFSSSSSSRTRHHNRRSLPPVPRQPSPARRRQPIAEEDECPVCHQELPSRTLANSEALRESHITNCIMVHSTYGGSPAAVVSPTSVGSTGEGPSSLPGALRPTVRRTGMFPYVATEKDCVDSAECTICLEEFEVGVMMARLECLCRFHHRCILAWFVGHPGRCPVHQHDSFGF